MLTTWQNGESDFIFYDARSIAKPIIVSTTGTTIRVKDSINNEGKVKCVTTDSAWYDSPHTFTGLDQGTVYQFICKDNNDTESDTVNGRTWNISGSSSSGLTSLIFTATHRAGTNGDSGKTITYKMLASRLNNKYSVQAIAGSLKRCPFSLLIPSHRVIRSDGKLGSYCLDTDIKKRLLEQEVISHK